MKEKLRLFIQEFNMLTPEEIDLIVDHARIESYPKGTFLLKEGQISEHCYFVLHGCVREYYLMDGVEKTTAFYTEFDPVNAFTSATEKKPAGHFLICAEDCVLTVGTESMELEMCRRIPRLENVIRQEVERHSGKAQDAFARFIMSTPEQRYLHLMETRPGLIQRMPQHQIASYLGITPESLSRIRKRILMARN